MNWRRNWVRSGLVPLAGLLLAGCSVTPPTPKPNRAFEKFRQGVIDGDFDTVFNLMSPSLKSQWVYGIYVTRPRANGGNQTLRQIQDEYTPKLSKTQYTELEAWLRANRLNQGSPLVSPLPDLLLSDKWTYDLLKEYFLLTHKHLKHEFAMMEVMNQARPDEGRASLIIKNLKDQQEIYELVEAEDGWKVNYHRSAPPKGGR